MEEQKTFDLRLGLLDNNIFVSSEAGNATLSTIVSTKLIHPEL